MVCMPQEEAELTTPSSRSLGMSIMDPLTVFTTNSCKNEENGVDHCILSLSASHTCSHTPVGPFTPRYEIHNPLSVFMLDLR